MGRRGKFIDKSRATTYSLVFRPGADGKDERVFIRTGGDKGGLSDEEDEVATSPGGEEEEQQERKYPPGHPLAWLEEEELAAASGGGLSSEKRQELLELGFPDDGYDYLQHLKELSAPAQRQAARADREAAARAAGEDPGAPAGGAPPRAYRPPRGQDGFGGLREDGIGEVGGEPARAEAPEGPTGAAVFVAAPVRPGQDTSVLAPREDRALYDATALTLLAPAVGEEEAAEQAGGVTAFSRRARRAPAAARLELDELERSMAHAERSEGRAVPRGARPGEGPSAAEGDAGVGGASASATGAVDAGASAASAAAASDSDADEVADFLDGFVLAAAERGEGAASDEEVVFSDGDEESFDGSEFDEDEFSDIASEEEGEGEGAGGAGGPGPAALTSGALAAIPGAPNLRPTGSLSGRSVYTSASTRRPAGPGSIASTYWREEREDRKGALPQIDEAFEALAMEYDEDEIGELSDGEVVTRNDPALTQRQLDRAYSQILGNEQAGENLATARARAAASKGLTRVAGGVGEDEEALVRTKEVVREATERYEQEEREADARGGRVRRDFGLLKTDLVDAPAEVREKWDCETVLSTLSNLDNHPGRIADGPGLGRRRVRAASAASAASTLPIQLDRNGVPVLARGDRPGAAARAARIDAAALAAAAAAGSAADDLADDLAAARLAPPPQARDRNESAEDKRARKAGVKAERKAARDAKRELKTLFKEERGKANRRAATSQPQAAMRLPS